MFTWLRYIPLFYFFLTLGKSIHGIHLIHQGDVRLSSTLNWSSRLDIYHRLYVHSQRHHPAIPSVSKISETSPPLSQCHRALMWSRILYLLPRTLLLHCQSHCFVYPLLGIVALHHVHRHDYVHTEWQRNYTYRLIQSIIIGMISHTHRPLGNNSNWQSWIHHGPRLPLPPTIVLIWPTWYHAILLAFSYRVLAVAMCRNIHIRMYTSRNCHHCWDWQTMPYISR